MHRQIWEPLLLATLISPRLSISAFSHETILRGSKPRHNCERGTIVPMDVITQLMEPG